MDNQHSELVDQYIAQYDAKTQKRLQTIRKAIFSAFPQSIEDISYDMPTYRSAPKKRGFVHFATFKDHIGIYGILDASSEPAVHHLMEQYRTGKGSLTFSHDNPLPMDHIRQFLAHQASKLES